MRPRTGDTERMDEGENPGTCRTYRSPKQPFGFRTRRMFMTNRMLRRIFRRGDVDCRDTWELGSGYLDDDLTPQKRSAVQAHLDKCGPCRAFIDGLLASFPGFLGVLRHHHSGSRFWIEPEKRISATETDCPPPSCWPAGLAAPAIAVLPPGTGTLMDT